MSMYSRLILSHDNNMYRQLLNGLLEELKDIINTSTKLNILPISVHERAGGILPHRTQTLKSY